MQWLITGNELLYIDSEDLVHHLTPQAVWNHFHDDPIAGLPSLTEIGLTCSSKYLSIFVKLVETRTSPFGKLRLEVKTHLGRSIELSSGHTSDHIVSNNVWMPLAEGSVKEILETLEKYGMQIGVPLTPKQYLVCARDLSNYSWFYIESEFSADEWSKTHTISSQSINLRFVATLADYQVRGSDWLTMMREHDIGVILGDSMGLGKTIQVIKTICDLIEDNPQSRTLVICPTALIENWCREIEKFTCGVAYMIHTGPTRSRN